MKVRRANFTGPESECIKTCDDTVLVLTRSKAPWMPTPFLAGRE